MWAKVMQRLLGREKVSRLASDRLIGIRTKQPSAVIRSFLEARRKDVTIRIDGERFTEADLPRLLDIWCTNRNIRDTMNFEIRHRGIPVFGFHDGIDEMWVDVSEKETIDSLLRDRYIRINANHNIQLTDLGKENA